MHYSRTAIIGLFALEAFMFAIGGARAAPYQDIPNGINEALFGGSNLYAAKMILSGGILLSIGLVMSMAGKKVNLMATAIVMLAMGGILVSIGWLDFWVMIVAGMLVVVMFGKAIASWATGG